VKVFRRGAMPELVATYQWAIFRTEIWPSGDGSRVYVALENGEMAVAIDTVSNKVSLKFQLDRRRKRWCTCRMQSRRQWYCQPDAARRSRETLRACI